MGKTGDKLGRNDAHFFIGSNEFGWNWFGPYDMDPGLCRNKEIIWEKSGHVVLLEITEGIAHNSHRPM